MTTVIEANALGNSSVVYCTVPEPAPGEVAHSMTKVYVEGDEIISTTSHRIYRSTTGRGAFVAVSVANPGVVTQENHGLAAGTPIALVPVDTLPSPLAAGVVYYVVDPTTNTYNLAATVGGAAINTTAAGSGSIKAVSFPNLGNDPATDVGDYWKDIGPTLRWRALDSDRRSQAVGASPMVYRLAPTSRVSAVWLGGMEADTVRLVVSKDGEVHYDQTRRLRRRKVRSWREWLTMPFGRTPSVLFRDLPLRTGVQYEITLTRSVGDVKLGALVAGAETYIGEMRIGAVVTGDNYSLINRDDFGDLQELTPRRTVPGFEGDLLCPANLVNRLRDLRDRLAGVPAVWLGIDDLSHPYAESLIIYGIYRRLDIPLDPVDTVSVPLKVEEY